MDLTATAYIVLGLLDRLGEASAYDLKRAAADLGNLWSTPHSQIYRTTEQLAASGHLGGRDEPTPGGRPRRVYALTKAGRAALAQWKRAPTTALPELRDPGLLKLYFGADPRRLARDRADAHRRQLESYRSLRRLDTGRPPRGPWLTLEAGIGHEREWVRFWERLARQ